MPEAATTQPTKLNPEEQKAVAEAQALSRQMMDRVGQTGVTHKQLPDLVAYAKKNGDETVMAAIPRQFILTLEGQARDTVMMPKGIHEVPTSIVDHWYAKAHGVEKYEGTAMVARPVPILSSNVFAGDKGIDPAAINDITVAAFTLSGLSAEAWNALTEDERGQLMMDVYGHRKRMAEAQRKKADPASQQ